MRLVELAHLKIKDLVKPGDLCIDATSGNGYDTLFLAKLVAPHGKVISFDIQKLATENTIKRLADHGLEGVVSCKTESHTEISNFVSKCEYGSIRAIMFNLGYLPGGNHAITTHKETTTLAIRMSYDALSLEGVMTVLCYRGHNGGQQETDAIIELCTSQEWDTERIMVNSAPDSPILLVIRKT